MGLLRSGHMPEKFSSPIEETAFLNEMRYFSIGPSTIPFDCVWNTTMKSSGLAIRDGGKTLCVVGDDGDHIGVLGKEKITHGTVIVTMQAKIPRPNKYAIGVLPQAPANYNRGFAYKNGVLGWGLHDHSGSLGIFCQTQQVAMSSSGFITNDKITMVVDVDRGNLIYKVNGVKCAEMLSCEIIKLGVYLGVTLFNRNSHFKILDE